ncbi:MAG: hypothetical protein WBA38_07265 [Gordonia sp. (in: high G+C Gram-positive bacteria)]|uniref:hypothetical protein n=1 Tax=Gordonia sp. (in: high G+C Gram-positive bacteria) TaxID=84139 RepID=UPI003C768265
MGSIRRKAVITMEAAKCQQEVRSVRTSRAWATLLAAVTLIFAGIAVDSPATAAPAAEAAAVLTPTEVASAPYGALFALGVPVYERIKTVSAHTIPTSRTLILKRLDGPTDGRRGSARFVFVGEALPRVFSAGEAVRGSGVPSGLILPLNPRTLERVPTRSYQMVSVVTGPIGEVRGVGIATRYLG